MIAGIYTFYTGPMIRQYSGESLGYHRYRKFTKLLKQQGITPMHVRLEQEQIVVTFIAKK